MMSFYILRAHRCRRAAASAAFSASPEAYIVGSFFFFWPSRCGRPPCGGWWLVGLAVGVVGGVGGVCGWRCVWWAVGGGWWRAELECVVGLTGGWQLERAVVSGGPWWWLEVVSLFVEGAPEFPDIHALESLCLRVGGDPARMSGGADGIAVERDRGNSRSARAKGGRWPGADLGSATWWVTRRSFPAPPVLSQASCRGYPAGVVRRLRWLPPTTAGKKKAYCNREGVPPCARG